VVFSALSNGQIDVYVDYAGTIWTNEMDRSDQIDRSAMLEEIGQWAMANTGVRLVGPLGFENTYAFAVRPQDAERFGPAIA
jgi:osmoprotectant transport system permease protein